MQKKKKHKKNTKKTPNFQSQPQLFYKSNSEINTFFGVNIAVCEHVVYIMIGRIKKTPNKY